MIFQRTIDTPVGRMRLVEQDEAITRITWCDDSLTDETPLLITAAEQLQAYFSGTLQEFDLPLGYHCSPFQQRVCQALCEIPYGSTMTYGELATTLKSAAQPVGNACGGNPMAVVVPCHRVLGTRGIGGYSGEGGIETKIALLKMENAIPWLI